MDDIQGPEDHLVTSSTAAQDLLDMESQTTRDHLNMTDEELVYQKMTSYWQYQWNLDIKKAVPPFIIILGTIGNVLSLIVLLRPRMRVKSTFLYLAGVAAADLIVLIVGPLRKWVTDIGNVDFAGRFNWVCKTVCFLGGVSTHYSVWLLVFVTLERFVVIAMPMIFPLVCRRSRALTAMGVLLGIVLAINVHVFWTHGIVQHSSNSPTQCQELSSQYPEFLTAWFWIDVCVYSILPFFIILTLNVLIIVNVRRAGRMGVALSSQVQTDVNLLTVMLLTLSFTFLLTTAPMSVYIMYRVLYVPEPLTPLWVAEITLARTLCLLIMWINHAINFFLYCLAGKKFRQELCTLMHCSGRSGSSWTPTKSSAVTTDTGNIRKENLQISLQNTELRD